MIEQKAVCVKIADLHQAKKTAAVAIGTAGGKWNTQLRELSKRGLYAQALIVYIQMLRSGASPNAFSFPFVLKSTAALLLHSSGTQLHCHVAKSGCHSEPFVQTSLISMYCNFHLLGDACKVFDGSPEARTSTVCYNALISGYVRKERFLDGLLLFREMRKNAVQLNAITILGLVPGCTAPIHLDLGMSLHGMALKSGLNNDMAVGNCFLSMFARCESIQLARKLFNEISVKGLITWNAMISGYSQGGHGMEVLDLYHDMQMCGVCPDEVTFLGLLSSCANLGAQRIGRELEEKIKLCGYGSNMFLKNALISMYARCGNLAKARAIFDSMPEKNLVSWTSILGAYGVHGHGQIAVELFDQMILLGIRPDKAVFVSVLTACSHAGLTEKGLDYFHSMEKIYGLKPGNEHFSCVVDLLGRAGQLAKALKVIESMPITPDGAVWGALLGACKIHNNVELAELAFDNVVKLEPTNIGYFVLLSNIYLEANNMEGILRIRAMMKERGIKKDPGHSYVEHKGKIHLFMAGDRSHPRTKEIYFMLEKLEGLSEMNRGKTENEHGILNSSGVHSERLAIAFALLEGNADARAPIRIMKNLRICGECHCFMKSVSKFIRYEVVVRDATRFHHFKDGSCSCNDYW